MVAILGLIINGASVFILGHDHLHVLADALTSLLAIVALFIAKYIGPVWMDPLMGVVGAILVSRWSLSLLNSTSAVLLGKQERKSLEIKIRQCI